MAGVEGPQGGTAGVGAEAFAGLHSRIVPLSYGNLGHYRVNHRCALVNSQAANSKIFELRNPHASNLIIITELIIKWLQTATHTAAIEDSLDLYKCTGFSAVDTTNTVTPTASVKRTTGMAAAPGAAAIRGLTVAGNSAGMTGGTMTKDGGSFAQLVQWLLAAVPTAGTLGVLSLDCAGDVSRNTHPFVFAQNEGFILENRVALGAAAGSSVYVDLSWAEVAAF